MKRRIYIYPTFVCNLQCPRCYQKKLDVPKDYSMSMTVCRRIFERLNEQNYKAQECVFTGGEPTCWPHLREGIETCRLYQPGARIRVVTNGFNRDIADYGAADVIQISDYGATNRMDQYRLKKQGGSRVRIQTAVHWEWDPAVRSELPGLCGCARPAFVDTQVWPCAMTAAVRTHRALSIEQDFVNILTNEDPYRQDFCAICLLNRKNRQAPRPVLQLSLWEGRSSIIG